MKKYLLGLLSGIILAGSFSALATIFYSANQIKYIKSNSEEVTLDSALNELYTNANSTISDLQNQISSNETTITSLNEQLNTFSFPLRVGSSSNTSYGRADFGGYYSEIKNKFKYFTFSNLSKSNANNTCSVQGLANSTWGDVSLNTKYLTSDYANIGMITYSYTNTWGYCTVRLTLSNS